MIWNGNIKVDFVGIDYKVVKSTGLKIESCCEICVRDVVSVSWQSVIMYLCNWTQIKLQIAEPVGVEEERTFEIKMV